MSDQSIILHLDRRWYDALTLQLKKEDMTVEEKLDEYLDAMIDRLPERTREKISREIWEAQRFSVLRVTQDGGTDCVRLEDPESMGALRAAAALRDYLRPKRDPLRPPQRFVRSVCGEELTPELFQAYAGELGQGTGRVTAVLDIDLDRGEFSILDAAGGWKTYAVSDVCTAAWLSFANSNGSLEWRLDTFAKHLEVAADLRQFKEIAPAGRLSDKQIVFSDEISEIDGRLNFYIDTGFDVDAVFGTHVCTGENDDCLNVYAEYDMAAGQVCGELEVDLHRADGREESVPYTLNDAEKAMLLHKMGGVLPGADRHDAEGLQRPAHG